MTTFGEDYSKDDSLLKHNHTAERLIFKDPCVAHLKFVVEALFLLEKKFKYIVKITKTIKFLSLVAKS